MAYFWLNYRYKLASHPSQIFYLAYINYEIMAMASILRSGFGSIKLRSKFLT